MNTSQPPIGYILKKLDTALADYTDKALQEHHITRLHWQVMNVVKGAGESADFSNIYSPMSAFVDEPGMKKLLDGLVELGWLGEADGNYRMTAKGEEGLAAAAQAQKRVREQVTQGLTEAEYAATIAALQKMLTNIS